MFTFPVDPNDLFEERATQMGAWGIPPATIREIRASIRTNWGTGPGCWTHEWVARAERAEQRKEWLLASALYGGARFPVACTPEREAALKKQVECFLRASRSFPVGFERRSVDLGDDIVVPVHVYQPRGRGPHPVVLLSGGVDTYKMELHRLAVIVCRLARARVAAIDMPGTGETPGPLRPDSDRVYEQVLDAIDPERDVKRAVFGISFGGHWAAKLALRGRIDAAVDLGGPVGSVPLDEEYLLRLPNGMTGIVANALGFDALPTLDEVGRWISAFSLREQGLFATAANPLPILAINGLGDPYIPIEETLVFDGWNGARAWLFTDGDHCAANVLHRVVPAIISFLRLRLHGETLFNRTIDAVARRVLPRKSSHPPTPSRLLAASA